ncbi:MAG TPA: YggS family pyridoxal phosphate-dependent enzyme [Myxococcales bacterium]|nr:YggS family pyridoxal phosphate-dependent enzyme [Myxococcales bacterium]
MEGLNRVRERIAAAAAKAGRDVRQIKLIAVSKLQPLEKLREAVAAGHTVFGENYAQELREKAEALGPGVEWHFIGALQSNKARLVVGRAAVIHTCDRLSLAREISKRATAPQRVLLEVNVGREPQKAGVLPEDAPALLEQVRALPNLACEGLMCIPPADQDPRPHFRALRELAERLQLRELSMGMSTDFEAAIEEGATMVRVGTAIFGERPRK